VHIRHAGPADAADIAKVHVDSWRSTYASVVPKSYLGSLSYEGQKHMWRDVLSNIGMGEFVLVVENDEEEVVGFGSAGPAREEDPHYASELYAIYLLPDYQRQGLGTKLIQALTKGLLGVGIQSMLVWVLTDNPSRRFYEALV
jgi:GNAT superfamily N-acetyltransferase